MSSNKFHFISFLYINFSHTYLNHFLPILALLTTTTWSFTFFRYSLDNTKLLGCDSTGILTLVDGMQAPAYPNPQALFILNEI